MTRLITLGEPLAVFTAQHTGAVRTGDHFRVGLGGAECNVAVAARRLGVDSAVVGVVGGDPLGAALLRALRADEVDVSGVRVDDGRFTGVMVKEMRTANQVRISYARTGSAGSTVSPEHLDSVDLESAAMLHSTGVTASFGEQARAAQCLAAERVRGTGGLVTFDVNYRSRLWPDVDEARKALLARVSEADVVFLGPAEAEVLGISGGPDQVLDAVRTLGPTQVVYKAAGSVVAVDGSERSQLAVVAAAAVDPVGAGDAFAAGYLVRLLQGVDLDERVRAAVALGLWSVTTHGDNDGLPYADELSAYEKDNVLR